MPKHKTISQKFFEKIRVFLQGNALIFLIFLFISTFFWFLQSLSKQQEVELTVGIEYVNVPSDFLLTNNIPKEMKVSVKGVGATLFTFKYLSPKMRLKIDLANQLTDTIGSIQISTTDIRTLAQNLYPEGVSIVSTSLQTFPIEYARVFSKKVPIVLVEKITLSNQYVFSDSIRLNPAYVEIHGAKERLDSINEVYTKKLVLDDISVETTVKVDLQPIPNVKMDIKNTSVTVPVEMFTEKTLALQIETINLPPGILVRTFPSSVNVTFFVGLSKYEKIDAKHFHIYLDCSNMLNETRNQLPIKVRCDLPYVSNMRLSANSVEYTIEQDK